MSKRKKKYPEEIDYFWNFIHENDLERMVTQFSRYHYRLATSIKIIDVWPETKKYWIHGTKGSVTYKNVKEIGEEIKSIFIKKIEVPLFSEDLIKYLEIKEDPFFSRGMNQSPGLPPGVEQRNLE